MDCDMPIVGSSKTLTKSYQASNDVPRLSTDQHYQSNTSKEKQRRIDDDDDELTALKAQLEKTRFELDAINKIARLERERAQIEIQQLQYQAETLSNQLSKIRARDEIAELRKRFHPSATTTTPTTTTPTTPTTTTGNRRSNRLNEVDALDWALDHDFEAKRNDTFYLHSLTERAETAEANERGLRRDVKYLAKRLRDSMSQLARVETELRKSRASFLVTAPVIEERVEIVLPSGERIDFKERARQDEDEDEGRWGSRMRRSGTMGDAEAEHLLLAARTVGKIRRIQRVPLDRAIKRRAKEINRLPSALLDGEQSSIHHHAKRQSAPRQTSAGPSFNRLAKRFQRAHAATVDPDYDQLHFEDEEMEEDYEATDVDEPEQREEEIEHVEYPKRIPSALDVLAEASSAASQEHSQQSQSSSENVFGHFSGASTSSSAATSAPAEAFTGFAPPPPPGGVFRALQPPAFPVAVPSHSTPQPQASTSKLPPTATTTKRAASTGASPQQPPRKRRYSLTSGTSSSSAKPKVSPAFPLKSVAAPVISRPAPPPVAIYPPAVSPLPPKAPAWVNGKQRKPRASIAGAKKERAAYIKWTDAEDEILIQAVLRNGLKWENVAADVPARTYHQVRQRFLRGLKSGWTLPPSLEHYSAKIKKVVEEHDTIKPRGKAKSTTSSSGSGRKKRRSRRDDDDDEDDEDDEDEDDEDEDEDDEEDEDDDDSHDDGGVSA